MASVEQRLYNAAEYGRIEEVEALLRDHPDLDVNWANHDSWPALHFASWHGHVEVVKLLLAHPAINVNVQTRSGSLPFFLLVTMAKCQLCSCC